LVFNLSGPFKQNFVLANAVMRRLVPDLVGESPTCCSNTRPAAARPRLPALTADHFVTGSVVLAAVAKRAWSVPGEIGRSRCAAYYGAEELSMSYRKYTLGILERGRYL